MTAHTPALIKEVSFTDLRLPYTPAVEVFGIDNVGWKVLIDTVFPSAKTVDSVVMALTYCRRRELDVFKKVVHIVPMWSAAKSATIETIWPGIAELRTTAFRTGQYAGCDEAEFGPGVESRFTATVRGEKREEEVLYPEWCRITTYRVLHGQRCKFVGPKVYWEEAYGRWKGSAVPNDMWCKRPVGQIEKCAEAASLRRAFPEEIGNQLSAEEMEGQRATGDIGGYEVPEPHAIKRPNPALIQHTVLDTVKTGDTAREGELVGAKGEEEKKPARRPNPNTPAPADLDEHWKREGYLAHGRDLARSAVPSDLSVRHRNMWTGGWDDAAEEAARGKDAPLDENKVVARLETRLQDVRDDDDLATAWEETVAIDYPRMSAEGKKRADEIYRNKQSALRGG